MICSVLNSLQDLMYEVLISELARKIGAYFAIHVTKICRQMERDCHCIQLWDTLVVTEYIVSINLGEYQRDGDRKVMLFCHLVI